MIRRFLLPLLWLPLVVDAATPPTPPSTPPSLDQQPVFAHAARIEALAKLLAPVTEPLAKAQGLDGAFTQSNHLHEMPRRLLSSGMFLVARGLGVDWHTVKPFDAEVTLTPTALIQRSGGDTQVVGADRQAGLAAVSRTFDALFTLDLPTLAQRFQLYGMRQGDDWVLGLKPRDAALAAHLAGVVVEGRAQPRQVTLYQGQGDSTVIRFEDVKVLPTLTDAQRARFSAK